MCVAEGYREYERGPISIHLSEPSPSVLQETVDDNRQQPSTTVDNRHLVAVSSVCVIKIIFDIFGNKFNRASEDEPCFSLPPCSDDVI